MSRQSSATINYTLTSYAQGHMNDLAQTMRVAERLAPTVPVPGGTGQYKVFNDENSFDIYTTARALGGDANRIAFTADDASFNTKPNALEVTVDQEERDHAGSGGGDAALANQLLDEGKVRALLNATSLAHVKKVVDFVDAAITPEADLGVWTNPDIDPIEQMDQVVDQLATACGDVNGIKLTIDLTSWRVCRNHPKVKGRTSGVQVAGISLEQLRSMLAIPVDVEVHAISYNTAKLGQTKSKARIGAGRVFFTYSTPNPTQYDPSAFKVFTMNRNKVTAVRTWQHPSGRYDVHAIDWSEDLRETSTIGRRKIAVTTQ